MALTRRAVLAGMAVTPWVANAAEPLRLGLQEGGTASWEIAALPGPVEVRWVADSRAGQIALQTGEVDVILSDFVWVSGQRNHGSDFTLVPHSLSVGGLMIDPNGPVNMVADLKGRTLAVAGGPLDKSYIILQAYFHAQTGSFLPAVVDAKFGAPPLVNELLARAEAQAALNYWHFNVRARLAGMVELVSVADMLAGLGMTRKPPLLGWVFSEATAARKAAEIKAFLDTSFATKARLLTDDGLWDQVRPVMKGAETDDALFTALRDGYREGIVTSYGVADVQAAAEIYALIAKYGGPEAVGDVAVLAPGTFWAGYRKQG